MAASAGLGKRIGVLDLFGAAWQDLCLSDVQAFMADAPAEGLLWEAKGTELRKDSLRSHACAFANSAQGGFLILGASEKKGRHVDPAQRWNFEGFEFPGDDGPTTWITQVLRDALRPVPAIDVRVFDVSEGRHVAVVWVPPVDVPPCLYDGTVLERVPGSSVTVKDPQRLQDLYLAGQRAHERASSAAYGTAKMLFGDAKLEGLGVDRQESSAGFSLAVCPLTRAGNPDTEIHRVRFAQEFAAHAGPLLVEGQQASRAPDLGQTQESVSWVGRSWTGRFEWRGVAVRDGSVGLAYRRFAEAAEPAVLAEPICRAWETAHAVAERLDGKGDHYMVLLLGGEPYTSGIMTLGPSVNALVVRRGPVLVPAREGSEQAQHLLREVTRCAGREFAWEPEP